MTTIRDVARQLNVSTTTISRAIDGYSDVSDVTRQLVIRTAREMGYSPNRAARQLKRNKAETIGFIIPSSTLRFDEPLFMEFIAGLGRELTGNRYDLLVANAITGEDERDLYNRWVHGRKVDGFVLNRMSSNDWRVLFLSEAKVPFVSMGKSRDGIDYPCIRVEGADGYMALTKHLLEKGFSRFAFIGGLNELTMHVDRLQWFKAVLKKYKLPLDSEDVLCTDMTSDGGYSAAKLLLSRPVKPDALLCVNDDVAYGAIHAAHEQGMVVGKDVAIAGFEGLRDSMHTEPPLTTLDIPVPEIAGRLVQMLLAMLEGQELPEREIIVQPNLVIRASTGG